MGSKHFDDAACSTVVLFDYYMVYECSDLQHFVPLQYPEQIAT